MKKIVIISGPLVNYWKNLVLDLSKKAIEKYGELINQKFYFYTKILRYPHDILYEESKDDNFDFVLTSPKIIWNNLSNIENEFLVSKLKRDDEVLIKVIEELEVKAERDVKLKIVEIPDNINWLIIRDEDEECEYLYEMNRMWKSTT